MKKLIQDTFEFVIKVYTYFAPALFIMSALVLTLFSYYSDFYTMVGGVVITLAVLHCIVGTVLMYNANRWWLMEQEHSLVNTFAIMSILMFCIWLSPMALTDDITTAFLVNWVFLGINVVISK